MSKDEEIFELNATKLGILVIIILLIHSLYLINVQEKKIKKEPTISNLDLVKQSLLNRFIALIVTFIFLYFQIKNYNELKQNNAKEEQINRQIARIVISGLAFISVLIEVILNIYNYYEVKKTTQNELNPKSWTVYK